MSEFNVHVLNNTNDDYKVCLYTVDPFAVEGYETLAWKVSRVDTKLTDDDITNSITFTWNQRPEWGLFWRNIPKKMIRSENAPNLTQNNQENFDLVLGDSNTEFFNLEQLMGGDKPNFMKNIPVDNVDGMDIEVGLTLNNLPCQSTVFDFTEINFDFLPPIEPAYFLTLSRIDNESTGSDNNTTGNDTDEAQSSSNNYSGQVVEGQKLDISRIKNPLSVIFPVDTPQLYTVIQVR